MKQKFNIINSTCVPLPLENVDTDQIIPARFLKATTKEGFGENLFRDWRYDKQGNKIESFYDLYAIPVESVFVQPALLPTNRNIPAKRKAIYANDNIPYGQLVEKLFNVNLEHENKMTQWQLTKMQIKSAIKRILLLR